MRSHLLKTVDPHYGNVKSGRKTFEFRKNDREGGFREGDILVLRHWVKDPEENKWFYYPGETLYRQVTHILLPQDVVGLSSGYCIMSLQDFAPPMPVIAICPRCFTQHIDADDWTLIPHRKHLCAQCGQVWKLAAVPTVGVWEIPRPELLMTAARGTTVRVIDPDA